MVDSSYDDSPAGSPTPEEIAANQPLWNTLLAVQAGRPDRPSHLGMPNTTVAPEEEKPCRRSS